VRAPVRATVVVVLAAAVLVACAASHGSRNARLGSGPGACWDVDSTCGRSGECCSLWCVNGFCERREP
jgi:hypothetical protein